VLERFGGRPISSRDRVKALREIRCSVAYSREAPSRPKSVLTDKNAMYGASFHLDSSLRQWSSVVQVSQACFQVQKREEPFLGLSRANGGGQCCHFESGMGA